MKNYSAEQERINNPVSLEELERRWSAVRMAMREHQIDILIMQNNSDYEAGYVKWFTDLPALNGVPCIVIFKKDEEMTVISHGPAAPDEPRWPGPSYALRGVKRHLNGPFHPSFCITNDYSGSMAVEELKPTGKSRIGWIGLSNITANFYIYLTANLPDAIFMDCTNIIDEIKAVKSQEEIELIRKAAFVADEGLRAAVDSIKPGMKDCEVYAEVERRVLQLGCEQQLAMLSSGPYGTQIPTLLTRHFMNRTLRDGDQMNLMVEVNGPGGMWTELGRTICIGRASKDLEDAWKGSRDAQHYAASLLRPGAEPKDIYQKFSAYMLSKGYSKEGRLFSHSQGCSAIERPRMGDDEPMKVKANMNIVIHPTAATEKARAWCSDNYLVGESGVERIHKTPQQIFVV